MVSFQGQQYSAHTTILHYRVGQHDVASMDKALLIEGLMVVFVVMICLCWKEVSAM